MSVALLPRYEIPGYEGIDPEEAAEMLHQEKNRPEGPPSAVLRKVVRAYSSLTAAEKAFPAAMYREWSEDRRQMARLRAAARLNMNVANPIELEQIDAYIGHYESINAKTQADQDAFLLAGWSKTPDEAKAAAFLTHRVLATAAAVSYTDDKKILSPKALAEREVRDDAQPDHAPDIPEAPIRRRGRKPKVT